MKKIKVGIIGMGYIGESHIEAVRRIGLCELYAIADTNADLAKAKAEFGIASHSKVMDQEVGQMIAAGIALGIKDGVPMIEDRMRDVTGLITSPQYASAFAGSGTVNNNSMTYEGAQIVINAAPGQDANEIAEAVSYRLNAEYNRVRSVWGIA